MRFPSILALLATLELSNAFTVTRWNSSPISQLSQLRSTPEENDGNIPERSRIEGNARGASESEIAVMDEMIERLADAKPYELPNAVRRAFRVISSPQFFMRIAELSDKAEGDRQEKLSALASNLVATLEAVVETTEERLDERANDVEKVLKAAAEPESGEFLVPLLPDQVVSMRKVLEGLDPSALDESFLSTVDAWMDKSHKDGMDGMVSILQKVLQMYGGVQISRARAALFSQEESGDVSNIVDTLLNSDADQWDAEIESGLQKVEKNALVTEIQRTMETVVLGLENGSMSQQVQAEFLRELLTRVESK